MSAAPRERSGEAGGLLNLMRVFGTSVGVAGASAVLSWRLATLLVAFAVIVGATSVLRAPPARAPV